MRLLSLILLLLQCTDLVASEPSWTLHESCYETQDMGKAIIKAVDIAKGLASKAAQKLRETKGNAKSDYKKIVQYLVESAGYDETVEKLAVKYDKFASLEGPVGKPPEEWTGNIFFQSEAWATLRNQRGEMHFYDFVITCNPDVGKGTPFDDGIERDIDFIREAAIAQDNIQFQIKREIQQGKYDWELIDETKPKPITQAATMARGTLDRKDRPETINLHGLWLKREKDTGDGYHLTNNQEIKDASLSRMRAVWEKTTLKFKGATNQKIKKVRPIDGLLGLQGLILHEMFHLDAFGALKDEGGDLAYGWVNNVQIKNYENPDLLAYLAFVIDMFESGYEVKEDGYITK